MIQMKNSYILSAISLMSIPAITTYAAEKKVLDPKHPEKKNVILILTDDMRFDMLNYAGGKAKTPTWTNCVIRVQTFLMLVP